MANEGRAEDTEFMTREEREAAGRRVNAGFAQYERYEHPAESAEVSPTDIPTSPVIQKLLDKHKISKLPVSKKGLFRPSKRLRNSPFL